MYDNLTLKIRAYLGLKKAEKVVRDWEAERFADVLPAPLTDQ